MGDVRDGFHEQRFRARHATATAKPDPQLPRQIAEDFVGAGLDIAQQLGRTPAQVALNWTMCKGTIPIPGAKNAQQVQQNAGALGWRLPPRRQSLHEFRDRG